MVKKIQTAEEEGEEWYLSREGNATKEENEVFKIHERRKFYESRNKQWRRRENFIKGEEISA